MCHANADAYAHPDHPALRTLPADDNQRRVIAVLTRLLKDDLIVPCRSNV